MDCGSHGSAMAGSDARNSDRLRGVCNAHEISSEIQLSCVSIIGSVQDFRSEEPTDRAEATTGKQLICARAMRAVCIDLICVGLNLLLT